MAEAMVASFSAMRTRCYLSFDFGTRRVGVASGNTLLRSAQPLKTVAAEGDARFAAIAKLIAEWQPDALVVGVPFHPDGAAHDNTQRARRFARQLHGRFNLPVHEVDERYTTTEALADGAADADAAAAAIILNQYFASRKVSTTMLQLDAEALYAELRHGVRGLLRDEAALVGIWSGGAWLAERLQRDLGLPGQPGVISSTLHRDDFHERGLSAGAGPTQLPFAIDGRHIVLLDDVLYTGRTIRAVLNELFDFGRPASVTLAVLVDRGGREMPIAAAFAAARIVLPAAQRLALARADDGRFEFSVQEKA